MYEHNRAQLLAKSEFRDARGGSIRRLKGGILSSGLSSLKQSNE